MSVKSKTARHELDEQKRKEKLLGEHFLEDLHVYRIDRINFKVYVGGDPRVDTAVGEEPGVEHNMADRFAINMGILQEIDPARPVLVEVATCGGNWDHGCKMLGTILAYPAPVTVLSTYDARSMSSIFVLGADRNLLQPPAQYMYHLGTYAIEGPEQEISTEDIQRRIDLERMYRIYTARLKLQGIFSGQDEKVIREALEDNIRKKINVWHSAQEAKRMGFIDDVFEGNWKSLRTKRINHERRKAMWSALSEKLRPRLIFD